MCLQCLSRSVLFWSVCLDPANGNCMVAARGACVRCRDVFTMDDVCVRYPAHSRVYDQQTAACQLCDDGYVPDGASALPATDCQEDHSGLSRVQLLRALDRIFE